MTNQYRILRNQNGKYKVQQRAKFTDICGDPVWEDISGFLGSKDEADKCLETWLRENTWEVVE